VPLLARILFPRLTARVRRIFGRIVRTPPLTRLQLERSTPTPGPENGEVGFDVEEMTDAAERMLRDIGLTSGFARLVLLHGHGSDSLNNPHNSAYNCGGCGGVAGGPNVRTMASIIDDPRVRQGLLLFAVPLAGAYAAVRLLLPVGSNWVFRLIGVVSLATAVYAAGMASVQREARRFFAHVFLSHAALVMVGLEMHTDISLTRSLCLWFSVILSLGGYGLALRALEARFGRLSLSEYHGLYDHLPTLAVCFLPTGPASVGFPGTVGFVSADLLVDGAVEANPFVGLAVVLAAAINGIAVMRAYFLLFTGARHGSTVALAITPRERFAVLTLSVLILGGGVFPQPGIMSRQHATEMILAGT
jgi:hypothetical protein